MPNFVHSERTFIRQNSILFHHSYANTLLQRSVDPEDLLVPQSVVKNALLKNGFVWIIYMYKSVYHGLSKCHTSNSFLSYSIHLLQIIR